MWLIHVDTFNLRHFTQAPPYAILSHQWGPDEEEVTFAEMRFESLRESVAVPNKEGFAKIQGCCVQALKDSLDYAWVDTCCINKDSSAELSEAINSMFNWYAKADKCYAYLRDVDGRKCVMEESLTRFQRSSWFLRGWTLQELIAPPEVNFFDRHWQFLGKRSELVGPIAAATRIDKRLLQAKESISDYNVAEKMSWAAKRQTTRPEDMAYCLMGLFDVNMPMLYGEGTKAFMRLQEEIIRKDDDHTIFAWSKPPGEMTISGLLAPDPMGFDTNIIDGLRSFGGSRSFQITNRGLALILELSPWTANTYIAWLDGVQTTPSSRPRYEIEDEQSKSLSPHKYGMVEEEQWKVGIFLHKLEDEDQYARYFPRGESFHVAKSSARYYKKYTPICVRNRHDHGRGYIDPTPMTYGIECGSLARHLLAHTTDRYGSFLGYDKIALLQAGHCGTTVITTFPPFHSSVWLVFGFDFQFNPVCIFHAAPCRHDPNENNERPCLSPFKHLADPNTDPCLTFEKWRIVSPSERFTFIGRDWAQDGICYLKGDRNFGLSVWLDFGPAPADAKLHLTLVKRYADGGFVWNCNMFLLDGTKNFRH